MTATMTADFTLNEHRGSKSKWGDNIALWQKDNFVNLDINTDLVPLYGHKTPLPQVGQTIKGEFQRSWIKFVLVEVNPCNDPPDMFFAKAKAIQQVLKP